MKKATKIVPVIIIGLLFSYTAFAQTSTSTADQHMLILQLQEQIKVLEAKITELQTELKATKSELVEVKEELRLTRTLRKGMIGEDVSQLQKFFKQFPDIYPEGLVTGFFGPLTEAAVQRFQEKQEIVSSGSPETTGFGQIGPRTISKLNELVAGGAGSSGKTPPGLTVAPGIQDKPVEQTPVAPTSTPSGTIPAIPAEPATPSPGTGTPVTPATPAVPATPNQPSPPPSQAITPPTISNVQATNITETSATIIWTTDEPASGEVHYALSSPITATSTIKVTGTNNVTSHNVSLTGLSPSKTYFYVAVSKDAAGNTATSSEQSFMTLTPPPPPPPVSSWSNIQITNFSGNGNIYYGEYPALVWNGSGYGIAWTGSDGTPVEQTNVENIFFKKIDSSGNTLNGHIRITDHGYCGCYTAAAPNVVWSGSKYGIAWADNKGDGTGQNLRFAILDSSGNKLNDIVLSVPNDNTNTNRPGLKWTGSVFAITWQGTNKFYAEVGSDGSVVIGKKVATDNEWDSVNTNDFSGTAFSSSGKIYFSDTNVAQELVSTVSGTNSWPFITWSGTKYAITWMNIQNNQLQLYFGSK